MIGRSPLAVAFLLAVVSAGHAAAGQSTTDASSPQAVARQLQQRFEVLLLREGVALRPKTANVKVRSVEITGGSIAVNGAPMSGSELREALGRDADLIIQLSYLDAQTLRSLFTPASETSAPAQPQIPPPDAAPVERESRDEPSRRRDRDGDDIVRIGSSIRVGENEVVAGDVVAVGGSAHVYGHVRGDVVAVMGGVELGPLAIVEGNVAVVGGPLSRATGARVDGRVKEVSFGALAGDWNVRGRGWNGWLERTGGSFFALFSTVTRAVVVSLFAVLVVLLAGAYVDKVGMQAAAEPLKAGAVGFLAQLLFLPLLIVTIVLLVVTLILIPLLALVPVVILGLVVAALVGFTAVAKQLGDLIARQFQWSMSNAYVTTLTGIVAVILPVLVARLALAAGGTGVSFLWHLVAFFGFCLEYLVWTVGFGAVALARFGKRSAFVDPLSTPGLG